MMWPRRHSSCTRLVTRGEDELWITPFAVIGHVRRHHDDAGDFCHADRARLSSGKSTRRRGSCEERKRRGSTAQAGHRPGVRCSTSRRHDDDDDDDDAATARMAPSVERRYVFTGNAAFMCKTNVGHQLGLHSCVSSLCSVLSGQPSSASREIRRSGARSRTVHEPTMLS